MAQSEKVIIGINLAKDERIMPIGEVERKVLKSEPYQSGRFVTVMVANKERKLFQSEYQIEEVTLNEQELKDLPDLKSPEIIEIQPFKKFVTFIDAEEKTTRVKIEYGGISRNPYFAITRHRAGSSGAGGWKPKNEPQKELLRLQDIYHLRENVPKDIEKQVDRIIKDIEKEESKNEFDDLDLEGWQLTAMKELSKQEDETFNVARDEGNYLELEGAGEYIVFENYDEAESYAIDRVKDDLDDNPSMFNQDWLQNHLYVSDTDKRIIAGEDNYAEEIREEDDGRRVCKEADREDDYDEIQDKIDEEEDSDKLSELETKKEELIDECVETVSSNQYDETYRRLDRELLDYLDELGYELNNLPSFVSIDTEEASKDAVGTDGVAHFLSGYDGNEIELPSGAYAYRTN